MRLYTVLLYFCGQLYVFRMIHHQEQTQSVITASGTGRTVFATARWRGGVGTCSWWWMRVSSETHRAIRRNIIKTVYNRILLDNYWLKNINSNGLFSNFLFPISRGLACCIKPQPGGPGDFWSRFSSYSPWYASIKLQGSSVVLVRPEYFISPVPAKSGEHSPIRHQGRRPMED